MKLPRFRQRTLLIAVAVVSLLLAWVAYQLNWIRHRHQFISQYATGNPYGKSGVSADRVAPPFLFLFGERGYAAVYVPESQIGRAQELSLKPMYFLSQPVRTTNSLANGLFIQLFDFRNRTAYLCKAPPWLFAPLVSLSNLRFHLRSSVPSLSRLSVSSWLILAQNFLAN